MKHAEKLYTLLKNGTLAPDSFAHEDHIRLAWYYLNRWGLEGAIKGFCCDLQHFVKQVGAEDKYHHTITVALLRLINSHLPDLNNPRDWQEFKADSLPLFIDAIALLGRFYSPEILASDIARHQWQEPDRQYLP